MPRTAAIAVLALGIALIAVALAGAPPPPAAASPAPGAVQLAQGGNPEGSQIDQNDEEAPTDSVPIPPNLLEPDSTQTPPGTIQVAPDTTRAPADTTGGAAGNVIPANPAQPETLRYIPPTDKAMAGKPGAPHPGTPALVPVKKPRGGLFGLGPVVVIAGLAVIHFLVIKAVSD